MHAPPFGGNRSLTGYMWHLTTPRQHFQGHDSQSIGSTSTTSLKNHFTLKATKVNDLCTKAKATSTCGYTRCVRMGCASCDTLPELYTYAHSASLQNVEIVQMLPRRVRCVAANVETCGERDAWCYNDNGTQCRAMSMYVDQGSCTGFVEHISQVCFPPSLRSSTYSDCAPRLQAVTSHWCTVIRVSVGTESRARAAHCS